MFATGYVLRPVYYGVEFQYFGDSGPLFIGGFVAVLPFVLFNDSTLLPEIKALVAGSFVIVPALEVFTLIIVRLYKGVPFYQGSPDHFSSYLLAKGWRCTSVLGYSFLCSIAVSFGGLALFWGFSTLKLFLTFLLLFVAFWFFIIKH